MYPTNEDPNDSPIVQTVRVSEPAVVSITITKDVPVIQRNFRSDSFGEQFFDDPFYFSFNLDLPSRWRIFHNTAHQFQLFVGRNIFL
jgi:hypothetical protein